MLYVPEKKIRKGTFLINEIIFLFAKINVWTFYYQDSKHKAL